MFEEEYEVVYAPAARIAIAQALIRLGSPKIRSLLIQDLFFKNEKFQGERIVSRVALAIFNLGHGPYRDDKEVLDLLRGVLGKENQILRFEEFGWIIPVLGYPVQEYYLHELAGYSLVNLGDLEKLEDILFAQLNSCAWEKKKDKFLNWVYSMDGPATIQALNNIAAYDPKNKKIGGKAVYKEMIVGLEAIGKEDCVKPLSILYDRGDGSLLVPVIKTLGKIGGPSALEIIRNAAENGKFGVRQNAKKVLKDLSKG
jgi:HEAT repeat protein